MAVRKRVSMFDIGNFRGIGRMNVLTTCPKTMCYIAAALYQHKDPRIDAMDLPSTRPCLRDVHIHIPVLEGGNVFPIMTDNANTQG
jgi:hypothetical protein